MGVRGLEAYMEKYCREACCKVNVGRLAQRSKLKNGDAKIVVDAQSCYSLWYQDLNWMIGLEITELINRLRDFIDSFENYGIQLIFFFAGLTPEKKWKRWIQKQRKIVEEYHAVFDCLTMNDQGNVDQITKKSNPIPVDMGLFSSYILKHILKCQVHMSVDECVNEIVDYVQEHNCFAILGQNTDFLLKKLNNAVVLSTKNFVLKTMTTLQYDPEKLAHHLGISREQLPLLALLTGNNEHIPSNKIVSFHRRLCDIKAPDEQIQLQKLMPAIGNYINRFPEYVPLERILKYIAEDLFGDSSQSELLEKIYKSYATRKIETDIIPEDKWFRILSVARDRHRTVKAPNIIYSIMNDGIFAWDHVFEDLRTTLDMNPMARDHPTSTVTRPLRQRLYGILLHEDPDAPITVQEWCAVNNYGYMKPTTVMPIQPIVHHPGLMQLWSGNNDVRSICERWSLFLSSIDSSLMKAQLQLTAFGDDIISCLSAYYLYETKFLDRNELDVILATIATHHLYRQRRDHLHDFTLDLRVSQISITFIRTYGLILTLLAACGYPIKLTPDNVIPKFDGKVFQMKYAEHIKNGPNLMSRNALCDNDRNCIHVFYIMRTFIRPETFKQSDNRK